MSLRPRFAGDGRLRLPEDVSVLRVDSALGRQGDVVGELGVHDLDPFERTSDDDLLLAESFARFDFARPRHAHEWLRQHGVLDLAHLFPEDFAAPDATEPDRFRDPLSDVLAQQATVRWHLTTLARLTAERERAGRPRPDWQPHEGWDPAWAQPALETSDGNVLWLGASTYFEGFIRPLMRGYPSYEAAQSSGEVDRLVMAPLDADERGDLWWVAAHRAWQRIERDGVPVLWVPKAGWDDQWAIYPFGAMAPHALRPIGTLPADWHGLVELERRLLEPYVRRAAERELFVGRRFVTEPEALGDLATLGLWAGPIGVAERRSWGSLLAPVYLQLFEALRRITEGQAGAAWCRECDQPFLTLDARRSSFCNDRERFRWSQRARRKRIADQPTAPQAGQP